MVMQVIDAISLIVIFKTTVKPLFILFSGDVNKQRYLERKEELQQAFLEKLNLRVYYPNPFGGNSNTGSVAKKAFDNPEIFSEITGFPLDLLKDLSFLLTTLRCGKKVDADLYDIVAQNWLRKFHSDCNLNWNWLSPSVHVVLVHGAQLLRALLIPPGLSSEEVAESANKVDSCCWRANRLIQF